MTALTISKRDAQICALQEAQCTIHLAVLSSLRAFHDDTIWSKTDLSMPCHAPGIWGWLPASRRVISLCKTLCPFWKSDGQISPESWPIAMGQHVVACGIRSHGFARLFRCPSSTLLAIAYGNPYFLLCTASKNALTVTSVQVLFPL